MNRRIASAVGAVAIVGSLFAASACHAGYDAEYRNTCNTLPKFKVRGHIYYTSGTHQSVQFNTDRGCGFAAVNMTSSDLTSAILNKRIGSSPYYYHYTVNSHWTTGKAFLAPEFLGADSLGIARNTLTAQVDVVPDVPSSAGTTITIHNFTGAMWARAASPFGASYRCIAWNGATIADSALTHANSLSDNDVRIENGAVVTTGVFSPGDFNVATVSDTTGYTVVRVLPVAGLSKTIHLSADDVNNTVTLSEFGDVGYGTFDPNAAYNDTASFPAPGLGRIGALIVAGLCLAGGAMVLRRRRPAALV